MNNNRPWLHCCGQCTDPETCETFRLEDPCMINLLDVIRSQPWYVPLSEITEDVCKKAGVPMFAGCESCGASLAVYNSYPSNTGYIRCADCIGDLGFPSVEAYQQWQAETEAAEQKEQQKLWDNHMHHMRGQCKNICPIHGTPYRNQWGSGGLEITHICDDCINEGL